MSLTRETLALAFELAPSPGRAVEAALKLAGAGLETGAASLLASRIGALESGQGAEVRTWLAGQEGATAAFVRAKLALSKREADPAIDELARAQAHLAKPDADVALLRARLLADAGRAGEAVREVQAALRSEPPYAFYARSEKLISRLTKSEGFHPKRRLKLALIGSPTLDLLAGVLKARGFATGLGLEIQKGDFGTWRQDILDPSSWLYAFEPDVVLNVLHASELELPPEGGRARAEAFCDELKALIRTLLARHPCHLVQLGFELPEEAPFGSLEDQLPEGRGRVIQAANGILAESLPVGASLIDPARLIRRLGSAWSDAGGWHRAKQYPAPDALAPFADLVLAQVRAALGLSSKVLVTDLDDTLWGGVIGEDGLAGIKIGPPDPAGEAHAALQSYLKALKDRGILLAVCSKNNPPDAELPFREHPDMVLKRDDFALFTANWQEKAGNIQRMAGTLGLGLDSLVVLDDNPVERAWIRERLPEVRVLEHDGTPEGMLRTLDGSRAFEALSLSAEDRARAESYQARARLQAVQAGSGGTSLEDFLAGLEMTARHGPVDEASLQRVTQLINKTNQFNLTTRRYTETQVAAMAEAPEWWLSWFRLADRYTDHGLIGVMAAEVVDEGRGPVFRLDLWLMSCRVLGRGMEAFMAARLIEAAKARGCRTLRGTFIPTAKNGQVADLLPRFGLAPAATPADLPEGSQVYEVDLAALDAPAAGAITDASAPAAGVDAPAA